MSEFKNLITFTNTKGCGFKPTDTYDYFIMIGLDKPYEYSEYTLNELLGFEDGYKNEYLKNVKWRLPDGIEIREFFQSDEFRQIYKNTSILDLPDNFSVWYNCDGLPNYASIYIWEDKTIVDFNSNPNSIYFYNHHILLVGKELKD